MFGILRCSVGKPSLTRQGTAAKVRNGSWKFCSTFVSLIVIKEIVVVGRVAYKRGFFPYRADECLHDVIGEDIPGNKNAPQKNEQKKFQNAQEHRLCEFTNIIMIIKGLIRKRMNGFKIIMYVKEIKGLILSQWYP